MPQEWEVVGGADKGGILVRQGQELKSPQCGDRLSTGAVIEQLSLAGERLHYKLLSGTGPEEGWISIKISGKELAVPKVAPADPAEWPARLSAALSAAPSAGTVKAAAPWVKPVGKAPAQARVRLVCFNWTGNRGGAGSAHNFTKWPKMIGELCPPDTWEVCDVAYPGRGMRMKEPNPTSAAEVAAAVADALAAAGPPTPTVLFGFSFGAVLAYETAQLLTKRGNAPLGLAVASAEHPGWAGRVKGAAPEGAPTKGMSDADFEGMLRAKGGTDVILNNEDMKRMYVPVIRADMLMEEAYGAAPPSHPPLPCPVVVFRGAACPQVSREDAEPWLERSGVAGAPSRVQEIETGLKPSEQGPWLSDWYLCQGEPSAAAMVAALARDFGAGQ